jgi:hypothetical protein
VNDGRPAIRERRRRRRNADRANVWKRSQRAWERNYNQTVTPDLRDRIVLTEPDLLEK